jgi:chemotaxis family two-component system response regulator Rcp1
MTELTVEQGGRAAELLLVEDNYGDVLLTQEAFRSAKIGNNLAVAVDGEEAMAMLRKEGRHLNHPTPDLILLDLNLPRMDGREVLRAIKSDPALHTIPVIVLTSSSAEIDILKSYELMANGYIVKPVTFDRLKEVVGLIESFWFTVVVLPSVALLEQANAS